MKPRMRMYRLILALCCFLFPLHLLTAGAYKQDLDCFSIIVGKKASVDGSVMLGHNEDVFAPVVNYYKVPGSSHTPGETIVLREGGKVPQAEKTFGYLWLNVPGWDVCDGYMNEQGVAVGSDGCPSREEKPDLTDGGILFWLRRLVAERARTAREGVKIAGELIGTLGYNSSGRSYVIADQNEGWVLAAVNGKHWVAQRVPDDQVAVVANCYTIQEIDLADTANFLGSPDIIEYATQRGWYDPSKDGTFNFARAYSNPGSLTHPGNTGRMWRGFDLLAGIKFDIHKQMPFAVVPGKKLTPQDLMRTMRDRYEGTEIKEPEQAAICGEGTRYSVVAHIRGWLPSEIKSVLWMAMYRPDMQGYSAWYPVVTALPESYVTEDPSSGLQKHLDPALKPKDREKSAALKTFMALDEKARANASARASAIKQEWNSFEQRSFKEQAQFEKRIAKALKQDPSGAVKLVTDHTAAKAGELYLKADELAKKLK